jgi:hypothetical protein
MITKIVVATLIVVVSAVGTRARAFETIQYPGSLHTIASDVFGDKIVGYYWNSSSALQHGFVYDGTTFATLDFPGSGSTALTGIDGDRIVGAYVTSRQYGFVVENGTFSTIDPPATSNAFYNGSTAQAVYGISVVGTFTDASARTHGYLFDGMSYSPIDYPANGVTMAWDIEGSNVVGHYTAAQMHGYLFNGTTFTSLDHPAAGSLGTVASGISGSTVVGRYYDTSLRSHGMIYRDGTYTTFDVPTALGTRTYIEGIFGEKIVGFYVDASGNHHGFLETIPEASSIVLAGLCIICCFGFHRHAR